MTNEYIIELDTIRGLATERKISYNMQKTVDGASSIIYHRLSADSGAKVGVHPEQVTSSVAIHISYFCIFIKKWFPKL